MSVTVSSVEPENAPGWGEDEASLFTREQNLSFFSCKEEEEVHDCAATLKRGREEALPQPWQWEQKGAFSPLDFMQCEQVTRAQLVDAMFCNSVTHAGCDQDTVNAWVAWSFVFPTPSTKEFMRVLKKDSDKLRVIHIEFRRFETDLFNAWLEARDPSNAQMDLDTENGYDKIEWVTLEDFSNTPRAELDAYAAWLITQPYNKETPVFSQYRANSKHLRVTE